MADPVIESREMTYEGGVVGSSPVFAQAQKRKADSIYDDDSVDEHVAKKSSNGIDELANSADSNIAEVDVRGDPCGHAQTNFNQHPLDDVDALRRIMRCLEHKSPIDPMNARFWPDFVWNKAYGDLRSATPMKFTVVVEREWYDMVADEVMTKAHKYLAPTVRMMLHDNDNGEPAFVELRFTEHADPTSLRDLSDFADTWKALCEWRRHLLLNGHPDCPLDEYLHDRLLHMTATKFQSARPFV